MNARIPLGAGLLDVARDRSLVRGIGAVPAAAAKQRDARCDIEEAGAKGPGRDIGSTSRTRAATDMKGRAREPGGGAAVAGTPPSKARPLRSPLRARRSLLHQLASRADRSRCHFSPRRRGCAALERRGPRDGRAGAARTSSPPPPSPCGRTSRRARPQRAAQGGAPLGAAVSEDAVRHGGAGVCEAMHKDPPVATHDTGQQS